MNKLDYFLNRKRINLNIDLSGIRIIAMTTMFIDHFALMIVGNGILYGYKQELYEAALQTISGQKWNFFYIVCRSIGRMSFPLFCFMLVEGYLKTHNRFLYGFRLLCLALISEIPFNLICGNSIFYRYKQNTVWTLLLGYILIIAIAHIDKKCKKYSDYIKLLIEFVVIGLFATISKIFSLDYDIIGIAMIGLVYIFYSDKLTRTAIIGVLSFINSFTGVGAQYFGLGVISIIPIWLYNGKLGSMDKYKLFYYSFYPLHMFVLYGMVFITFLKK